MSYDEGLAARVRRAVARRRGVSEKEMFGGIAFLLGGRMFCGIIKEDLMVRVGHRRYDEALRKPLVRPMDFTGKPMTGYVYVAPAGLVKDAALAEWVAWGAEFVSTLPAAQKQPPGKRQKTKQ